MNDCASNRKNRVEDFQRRAAFSPNAVYKHRARGWSYIPVHAFVDGTQTAVPSVDCWCLMGSDAALLECVAKEKSSREPGLYARVDGEGLYWPKLFVVLCEPLTREAIETVMQKFVELGFPDKLLMELQPGGSFIKLEG